MCVYLFVDETEKMKRVSLLQLLLSNTASAADLTLADPELTLCELLEAFSNLNESLAPLIVECLVRACVCV